jgi:hypothetical protein
MIRQSSALSNWSPASLLVSADQWQLDLATDHEALLARVARLSEGGLPWQEYLRAPVLVEMGPLYMRLTRLLWEGSCIALLRLGEDMSDDAMRLLLLLVGRALGRNIAPRVGAESRPLFAVTATDDPTIGGEYGGNARNARALALHTDGSGIHSGRVDILGMLCIRAAEQGGISRFADARTAYLELDDESRILLTAPFPRVDPYNPRLPVDRLISRPVFDLLPAQGVRDFRFSYHPQRVRDGIRLRDDGIIAQPLERALSTLDAVLDRSAIDVSIGRGDSVILNNNVVAHGRTAFQDHPVRSRLVERLWDEVDSE